MIERRYRRILDVSGKFGNDAARQPEHVMKTFWIVLLVAFLVFIIIHAIRSRHYSSSVYRARFFNRMPRERHPESKRQDSMYVAPVIFGAATDGAHAPASTPHCETGVADASGACSTGSDGGGASS
jgi:hypothetical protein